MVLLPNSMNNVTPTITFHPSSLFQAPNSSLDIIRPPNPASEYCDPNRERSHSSCSISSIDIEFTHFRPIKRAPMTGKQVVISMPRPVRATIVSSCSTPLLISIDETDDEERIKQEKMDCELAWRIHKQEKRIMLRPASKKSKGRRREQHKLDKMCKTGRKGIRHSLEGTLDCELAWRIHKQEKRVMLRQVSTRTQSPARNRSKQGQLRRQHARRMCQL